ncbi:MAG: hypothetical protein IJI53_06525 [Clostridia bacterium]|nr:hypothetical protein [Clostridia bacterium]
MNKKKRNAFAPFLNWLENGGNALDAEMQDALREHDPKEALPEKTKKAKKKAVPAQKDKAREERARKAYADSWWYRLLAVVTAVTLIWLLMEAVLQMPKFGAADTLIDSELTEFYVEHTKEETGAMNIVTGIILDYRGFDTLGESHVLFIAVCTVLLMLSIYGERDEESRLKRWEEERHYEPEHDVILQSAARLLTPLILIFGLYIIVNGHLSPGGGFSGGAVLGAGLILYQNAFGYEKIERFFTYKTFRWVSVCSLLFYSLAKGYHFFTGANHLDSHIPIGTPGNILAGGLLLPLNFVVGCVVACTMYALFTMFRKGEF